MLTDPRTAREKFTGKDKINVELINKIMTENKITLLSLEKVNVDIEKVKKNELIYAEKKLVSDRISALYRNLKRTIKSG